MIDAGLRQKCNSYKKLGLTCKLSNMTYGIIFKYDFYNFLLFIYLSSWCIGVLS